MNIKKKLGFVFSWVMVGVVLAILFSTFERLNQSAQAQTTNLIQSNGVVQPVYPTNTVAGGAYGIFIPLLIDAEGGTNSNWGTLGFTNTYTNGTNYLLANGTNVPAWYPSVWSNNPSATLTNIFPVGIPQSINVAVAFGCANSNACAGTATTKCICYLQESVDGYDWESLYPALTNTTVASQAAGTAMFVSTNYTVDAYSMIRVYQILSATDTNVLVFTNLHVGVSCKLNL